MTRIERLENRLKVIELNIKKAKCNKHIESFIKQATFVKQQLNKLNR